MENNKLYSKRRSAVRMFSQGHFRSLPFAYDLCTEDIYRFYDLRNLHFEDSPEAFLEYLEKRGGDTELAGLVREFLGKYDLYLYWLRFTRARVGAYKTKKEYRPTLQETRKVKKVISQAESCREGALTSSEVRT